MRLLLRHRQNELRRAPDARVPRPGDAVSQRQEEDRVKQGEDRRDV